MTHVTDNHSKLLSEISDSNNLVGRGFKNHVKRRVIYNKYPDRDEWDTMQPVFPALYTTLFYKDGNLVHSYKRGRLGIIFLINQNVLKHKPYFACCMNSFGDCAEEGSKLLTYGVGNLKRIRKNLEKFVGAEFLFDSISLKYVDAIIVLKDYPDKEDVKKKIKYYKKDGKNDFKPITFRQICQLYPDQNVIEITMDGDVYRNIFNVYRCLSKFEPF